MQECNCGNICNNCGGRLGLKTTWVHFILDKSGSMESVKKATISGFNEYIHKLQKDGNKYKFDLTLFDTESIEVMYEGKEVDGVKKLNEDTYRPQGGTPLYDAVCATIKKIDKDSGYKHLVVIMTDGEENSSKEYKMQDLKEIIRSRENNGNWTFVFLGANQDAWGNASSYGMSYSSNISNFKFDSAGVGSVFSAMSVSTGNLASSEGTSSRAFFSQKQQNDMQNGTAGQADKNI